MKRATHDWIKKAESDWICATVLARRRKIPLHDQACFHFQQSAEKYLKARMEEAGTHFPKTHDLQQLIQLVLPVEPLWSVLLPAAIHLTRYAVGFRYPGSEATEAEVKKAREDARAIRHKVRTALGV